MLNVTLYKEYNGF